MGLGWLVTGAQLAAAQSDVSITSVGVQTWTSSALFGTDADVGLAERLRWTLAGEQGGERATRLLTDARFTIDPGGEPTGGTNAFEWASVRQLGVEITRSGSSLRLGRHAVTMGGPRLYDGVEWLARPTESWDVGAWAGLAPDVFTTRPALRPGAGPVVAYGASRLQFSVVGDVTASVGDPARTGLDRVGVLSMVRAAADRAAEVSARVDLELVGAAGFRLVDGTVVGVVTPTDWFRGDVVYNAFSSYLYQNTTDLDPDLQRFAARSTFLGTGIDAIAVDTRDPNLNHVVGGALQFEPRQDDNAPRFKVTARNRFHPDPANQYFRLNPQVGMVRLGGGLDLLLDGNYLVVPMEPNESLVDPSRGSQWDAGLVGAFFPGEGTFGLDGSVRYVHAPDSLAAPAWYGDLYVDLVSEDLALLVTAGGSVVTEPDLAAVGEDEPTQDTGLGAYLRVAKYVRRKK